MDIVSKVKLNIKTATNWISGQRALDKQLGG